MLRNHAIHNNETKRREGAKGHSESPVELDNSKLEVVSVIASHLIVDEVQNIKDNRKRQREEHIKISSESQGNGIRENGKQAVESEAMRPCKTTPNFLHAADVPRLQNKGIDRDVEHGKAVNTETVMLKHCEIEQIVQSRSCLKNLYKSQHHLCSREESQYLNNKINFPKTQLTDTNNPTGNSLSVSTNTKRPLRNGSSEARSLQTEDKDLPNMNGSRSILYSEARSSQLEFKTGDLEKIGTMESQDLKTENLGRSEPKAFYKERNEMVGEACNPLKVTRLKESLSAVDVCTGRMSGKILWDPTNRIGPKAGIHRTATDRYSNVTAISMGWKLQNSTLFNGDEDTQLPDVEGRTCTTPILSPSSNSFGKQKLKLINKNSISLPNMKTFISGIRHHTKKRFRDNLSCSRTLTLVNAKPAPNTISASMEEWTNMNKEIVSETFGHLLSGDVQTHVELEHASQSKLKCEAENLIQEDLPCSVNQLKEEETIFKCPKSQNKHKENNTLQLLEVNGDLDNKYSEWQQASSGNFQLSSSIGLQTSNCPHVSQLALSETSHQQASHFTLSAHCFEQPRFIQSYESTLQKDGRHHGETCQFTRGQKLVVSVEFNAFDIIDGKENTLLDVPRANISPPVIVEFGHDECKKQEHVTPVMQKSATDISEHVLNEESVCKNFAFVDETHQSKGNKFVSSHAVTKETDLLVGSSAVPADGGIADSVSTEDEISQAETASTSFSWPYAWSLQSQEHWSQSTTTLESAPASEHSEGNLSHKVTSKDDKPGQWGTSMVHRENYLDVEDCVSRSATTSFQNVSSRSGTSINRESNLEQERPIQSPVRACSEKFSGHKDAEILNIGHCGHRQNYSKSNYKSVFQIIDAMQHSVPLDKAQHKVLQNSTALSAQATKAKLQMENVLIPLSPNRNVKGLQQFESLGSALEMDYPSSVYSRWFCKSAFGNRFAEQIPATVSEGDVLNTLPNVQCEKTNSGSAHNQTWAENEAPADVRDRGDAHVPVGLVQWSPPTREELLTDDELMLINMLHNLKRTLDFE
ncbi:uncharacterized protein LOC144685208 [Cetorhinus maximus]